MFLLLKCVRQSLYCFFLVTGAFEKPVKRNNSSQYAIVLKTVTVYAINIASQSISIITIGKAIDIVKSITETAIVISSSKILNISVVHYYH